MTEDFVPAGIRFGIVRGVSYGLFGKPDPFVAQARELGAGLVRVYVYWGQVEPQPGQYRWDVVDAVLDQLDGSEEVWVTVCSSSRWATQEPTDFLPPSPARDLETYSQFIHALVRHCGGRVRYWQCDNEPSNVGLLWAGTSDEYVAQLRVMHGAVKDADPGAAVVLGGAPYGLPQSAPDSPERRFFEVMLRDGRDSFDLFDLHLYADARRIPEDIEAARGMMRAFGYEKPIVVGEYNGPSPDQYPQAAAALQEVMMAAFAAPAGTAGTGETGTPERTPEQAAMAALYERMESLPPQLQMFMAGCPRELEDRRHRINCREIVVRNVEALAAGVRRTACWSLAPEVPNYEDHLAMMDLFYGKFPLMGYEGTELRRRHPSGQAFALLMRQLAGVERVIRRRAPERPTLRIFEMWRSERGPLLVVWDQRDPFAGEDEPPVSFEHPWRTGDATAVDALGQGQPVEVLDGRVKLSVSNTPVFVAAD